jgi:hypothetical protein
MNRFLVFLIALLTTSEAWAISRWSPSNLTAGSCSRFTWESGDAGDAQPALPVPPGELAFSAIVTTGSPNVSFYLLPSPGSDTPATALGSTLAANVTGMGLVPGYYSVNAGTVLDPDIDTAGSGGTIYVCSKGYSSTAPTRSSQLGITGDTGSEFTLGYLQTLRQFEGFPAGRFTTQLWVDPFDGNDATGTGSYATPWRSFQRIKERCLNRPNSRCTVKGEGRVFSNRTLTVTLSNTAGQNDGFIIGEGFNATAPVSTGTIYAYQGDKLVIDITTAATNDWTTAPEPVVGTVVTGSVSGTVATVTAFTDTVVGLPQLGPFAPAAMSVATPSVFTLNNHGRSNNDGPYRWINQTTFPTMSGIAVTQGITGIAGTDLYICSVTANTFELSSSSTCTAARVGVSATGAGQNQLIPEAAYGNTGVATSISASGSITPKCAERHNFCNLFESEKPEWPWAFHLGGFNIGEIRSLVDAGGGSGEIWSSDTAVPIGGLFIVHDAGAIPNKGWVGVQNGVVQNAAVDGPLAIEGGKIVTLNVIAKDIKNGFGDRSQFGETAARQRGHAHQTAFSATGPPASAGNVSSVGYFLNIDGSSNQMGSDIGSGGLFNANLGGIMRVMSRGTVSSDGITGDTNCSGGVCTSASIVIPEGEMIVVGPIELKTGPTTTDGRGIGSFAARHLGVYKTLFNRSGAHGVDVTIAPWLFANPNSDGFARFLDGNEITVRTAGFGTLFLPCPQTAGSTVTITLKNMVVEPLNGTWRTSISNCGVGGTVTADSVTPYRVTIEGIIDHNDSGTLDRYFFDPNGRDLGACNSSGTFLDDICDTLVAAGLPTTNWRWFEDNSVESGGGSDGDQYNDGVSSDALFRCGTTQPCWRTAAPGSYFVNFHSRVLREEQSGDTCLPADVIGTRVCGFTLIASNKGAR